MKTTLFCGALLAGMAMMFVQCTADEDAMHPYDAGIEDASVSSWDAEVDADAQADVDATVVKDEFEVPDRRVVCEVSPCAVAITGGESSFCALLADKTVQCWGYDGAHLALGYPSDTYWFLPIHTYSVYPHRLNLSGIVSVSLGAGGIDPKAFSNGCAVDEGGSVYCWGAQGLVNAGNDPDPDAGATAPVLPTRMALVPPASSVAVSGATACVTTRSGTLSCWGMNDSGRLAHIAPTATPFSPPVEIQIGGPLPVRPWPGSSMFATTADGRLFAWGMARSYSSNKVAAEFLLGFETSEDFGVHPSLISSLSGVRAVTTSSTSIRAKHVCAIVGRYVECWGDNSLGQLGLGFASPGSQLPVRTILSEITDADDVDAGNPKGGDVPMLIHDAAGTCVLMGSGRIYCWGLGSGGNANQYPVIRRVDGPSDTVDFAASRSGSFCALRRSGEVDCWGSNLFGALGRGIDDTKFSDATPAPVVFEP